VGGGVCLACTEVDVGGVDLTDSLKFNFFRAKLNHTGMDAG